jgi:glycosyltransferase involved in cell wall biosynthesis
MRLHAQTIVNTGEANGLFVAPEAEHNDVDLLIPLTFSKESLRPRRTRPGTHDRHFSQGDSRNTEKMSETDEHVPIVSIGLPVFNGENYLREAIESILAQTFHDFELVISDNASTDRTEEIARHFADVDSRVRYHRNETNIGGARNQNQTVELARGRYFRLSAHDDLIAPTFLEECVAELERQPGIVICYPGTIVIDADGKEVAEYQAERGTAARSGDRFAELAFRTHNCDAVYGVVRSAVIKSTVPMGNFIDADKVFLCDLAMRGPFYALEKPLFYKRFHAKNYVADWRDRMAWYNPDRKGRPSFPNWLELRGFIRVVVTAKIEPWDRLKCGGTTMAWALWYSPKLAKDILVAARLMWYRARKQPLQATYNWE